MKTQPDRIDSSTAILEKVLSRYGFDVTPTRDLLAGFLVVQNTYLSTFQSLGGLGLLLGTVGLGIILIRNTIERRAELAAMRAFGFPKRRLSALVLLETCFQLALGIGLGTFSALVAVTPHLVAMREIVPWGSLAATLAVIFALGTLASVISLGIALRTPLIPALRSD